MTENDKEVKHLIWGIVVVFSFLFLVIGWIFTPTDFTINMESEQNMTQISENLAKIENTENTLSCFEGCYYAEGYVSDKCYLECRERSE